MIPNLAANLISVSQALDNGIEMVAFTKTDVIMMTDLKMMPKGKDGRLLPMVYFSKNGKHLPLAKKCTPPKPG